MARKSKADILKEIHNEAVERFKLCWDAEQKQRELAIEDILFVDSEEGQWDDIATEKRKNRPRYTIDRVSPSIDQVTGDQRQNRTRINVKPKGNGADEDTAKIYDGLIRNIEADSKAENSYDNAFSELLKGGYGGWRILNQYNDDDSFEQDLCIKPINSAVTSLFFDPDAEEYDKRDAKYCFIVSETTLTGFKDQYPNASITSFDNPVYRKGACGLWFTNNKIRHAEYWRKVPVVKKIALLSDGRVIDTEDEKDVLDELMAKGVKIVKERSVNSHRIERYKMNGAEILTDAPLVWPGKYIPAVPAYGKTSVVNGKTFVRGMVRKAKDPQRIYNYAKSNEIETTALTPKDPYWITPAQADGHESALEQFNVTNSPFMFYNPDPEAGGPPQRSGAPQVQQALISQQQQAALDIHATTGVHPPALGNAPQLLSERSVQSQIEMGDRGAFEYTDNLAKSIAYTGEILIDLIPRIYDTPRMVQILNIDGSTESVEINQEALNEFNETIIDEQTGEPVIVNDLKKGKYAVVTETGPAYKTMRQESASQLIDLAGVSPTFEQVATDLIAKNLNLIESDELTKRVRKLMIGQGIVDPTDDEIKELGLDQPQQPDPQQTALTDNINMQTEKLKSDIENQDAKTQETLLKTQNEAINGLVKMVEGIQKAIDAGIPIGEGAKRALITQTDIVQDAQDVITDGMPNSEEMSEMQQQIPMPQQPIE